MPKIKWTLSPLPLALVGLVLTSLLIWWPFTPAGLRADEEVIFLPTHAHQKGDGSWYVPIHAWVFEREDKDLSRRLGRWLIAEALERGGMSARAMISPLFVERIKYFLVDNKRGKQLKLSISSLAQSRPLLVTLDKSTPNGHVRTDLRYNGKDREGSWLTLSVNLPKGDQRSFLGQIKLVPRQGLSVICDIDDTIKLSNVLDKRELLRNSLLRPFKPIRTMSAYLRELEKEGAYFHYISASPWQLYPSLRQFMDNHVPRGAVGLRNFRLKDRSFLNFLKSSKSYKIERITAILKRYPQHRFMLIGDSGEHDPEVYGEIARSFGAQIKAITIRRVEGADNRQQRFEEAFTGLP